MAKTLEDRVAALEAAQELLELSEQQTQATQDRMYVEGGLTRALLRSNQQMTRDALRTLTNLQEHVDTGFNKINGDIAEIHRDMTESFAQNAAYQKEQEEKSDAQFARIDENFSLANENFRMIANQFTNVQTTQVTMQSDIDTIKTDITGLKAAQVTMQSDITGLKAAQTTMQSDIDTIKGDITGLKAAQVTMQSDITGLKAAQVTMQSDIDTIKGDITGIKDTLAIILARLPMPTQGT